jgi:hypothetical protein
MAEQQDTNKAPAAQEPSMDELLTQAAGDAVAEETSTTEPETSQPESEAAQPEGKPEPTEELDDEGLPKGHKERSELGRKLAALHRRQDETQETLQRVSQLLEKVAMAKTAPETPALDAPELDENEPVTYKEMLKIIERREQQKAAVKSNYDRTYVATIERTVAEYIDDEGKLNSAEIDGVLEEMKTITYTPSNDPEKDAISNLRRAERAFLKKQMAKPRQKVNPLKGEAPKSPLGVAPSGKSPAKSTPAIKLDKDAEAYLKFVSASDGAEKADKLRASMGFPE